MDALRPLTDAPLDTHLMIVEPEQRVGTICLSLSLKTLKEELHPSEMIALNGTSSCIFSKLLYTLLGYLRQTKLCKAAIPELESCCIECIEH